MEAVNTVALMLIKHSADPHALLVTWPHASCFISPIALAAVT